MDTELFMECEEEELEPWQLVDDGVEEDDVDFFTNYGEPVEESLSPLPASETPPPRTPPPRTPPFTPGPAASPPAAQHAPPIITSSLSSVTCLSAPPTPPVSAPPIMTQGPPLILTQTAGGTFLLPAASRTGNSQPILLTAQIQTKVERFRFEDDSGRTFESRGGMVICGGCGGKYFRIVSHLKKSRKCSSHLDLDTFERQLIVYNMKRKRNSDPKGFPMMNTGTPLVLNLQPGQSVQPLTLIQSSSLGPLIRPSVGVSPILNQSRVGPASSIGPAQSTSTFTRMQLPTTLTIHSSTPGPINLQMTQVGGANSVKMAGPPALPSSSANGVTRVTVISNSANLSTINTAPVASGHLSNPPKVVMSVEEFYYGTFEGDLSLRRPLPLGIKTTTFTCQICTHLADNNLRLMQHMLQHSQLIGSDDRKLCRYCFRQFSSPLQLQTHQELVHGSTLASSLCRICEWAFENEPTFLNHMKSNHKPGEMPYVCQVCSYRSSFYSDVLQHFASFHRDSRFLLCIFCLKVTRNPTSYQEHLLRHQVNQAFHCNRCRLQFVFLKDKMQHKHEHHRSFRRPAQLEGLPPGSKVTIRTYGKIRRPTISAGGRAHSSLVQPIHIKTEPQKSPVLSKSPRSSVHRPGGRRVHIYRMSCDDGRLMCLECGTDASDLSAHYPTHVHCLLCPYSSCCSRAYAAHMIYHHVPRSTDTVVPLHRRPPPCLFQLQCSNCDYRPQSADHMADHLLTNPDHYSATCRLKTYLEPDIQLCCDVEQHSSEDQEPDQNQDLSEPSWRLADCWKLPEDKFIADSTIAVFTESSGPCHSLNKTSDAIDFFNLLFPPSLVELITKETNNHAKTCHFLGHSPPEWLPVTTHEIKGFIGLVILMGIQNLPDPTQYWSWNHYDNSYTFYRAMSYKRFKQIAANIRMGSFIDDYRSINKPVDPLHIFRPMLDILGKAMWHAYRPNCCLTIDRALLPSLDEDSCDTKGNSKTQPQVWLLCDSKSGYCHRFFIQVGAKPNPEPGFTVVPELVKDLQNKHHQLYLANSLTSVPLMQKLLDQGIYASSSFPPPNPILPQELWEEGQLDKPGDFMQWQFGPLLATRWRDTKEMGCLSTNAGPGEADTVWRRSQTKVGGLDPIDRPMAFRLLQENMRGVDICKQLLACNPLGGIPQDRHWRSLFWLLVNLSIVNAFIILRESRKENPPAWVQDGLFTQVNFRKRLGNQLAKCAQKYFETMEVASSRGTRGEVPEKVVKERHRMGRISSVSKRCRNCNIKNVHHESVYGCVVCKANLCKQPICFWDFHGLSPLNQGSTKVGFLKDPVSGAVEVDEVQDNVDGAMAPIEDFDFSDDDQVDDMDDEPEDVKEEFIKVKHPTSDLLPSTDSHSQAETVLTKDRDDVLTARQLRVTLFALCDGLSQASRVFSTETQLIRSWLKEAKKHLKRREWDQNLDVDGDCHMVAWVLSMHEQQLPITESSLFHKASTLKKKGSFSDAFLISYDWAVSFMLRHKLGIRSVGTAATLRHVLPASLEAKVKSFQNFTQKIIFDHKLSNSSIAVMDEFSLFVDLRLVQDKHHRAEALEFTGSVPLITIYLTALADGTMLPSLVLVNQQLVKKDLPETILLEDRLKGLSAEEALDLWTNKVWLQHLSAQAQQSKSLLVLGRHREHIGDPFLASLSASGTLPAIIPGGCSIRLQPMEVCVKPVLQRFILSSWAKYSSGIPNELEWASPQFEATVAQLLMDWIVEALTLLNQLHQLWRNSFMLTGLLLKDEEEMRQKPEEAQLDLLKTLTKALLGNEALEDDSPDLLWVDEEDSEEEPEEDTGLPQEEEKKGQGLETPEVEQDEPEGQGQKTPNEKREELQDIEEVRKETEGRQGEGRNEDMEEDKKDEEDSEEEGKETEEERKVVNKERRETRIVIGEEVGDEWKIKSRTEGVEEDGDEDGPMDTS